MPRNTPVPEWRISDSLPWIGVARTIRPPKTWPIAWWPRQTPKTGTVGAARSISFRQMPASSGVPGPGETTIASGSARSTASTVILSLRWTTTSAPSPPR